MVQYNPTELRRQLIEMQSRLDALAESLSEACLFLEKNVPSESDWIDEKMNEFKNDFESEIIVMRELSEKYKEWAHRLLPVYIDCLRPGHPEAPQK